jgi:hypothetical protein
MHLPVQEDPSKRRGLGKTCKMEMKVEHILNITPKKRFLSNKRKKVLVFFLEKA